MHSNKNTNSTTMSQRMKVDITNMDTSRCSSDTVTASLMGKSLTLLQPKTVTKLHMSRYTKGLSIGVPYQQLILMRIHYYVHSTKTCWKEYYDLQSTHNSPEHSNAETCKLFPMKNDQNTELFLGGSLKVRVLVPFTLSVALLAIHPLKQSPEPHTLSVCKKLQCPGTCTQGNWCQAQGMLTSWGKKKPTTNLP